MTCEDCTKGMETLNSLVALTQKAFAVESDAARAGVAAEAACIAIPILDFACSFAVAAVEAGSAVAFVLTWAAAEVANHYISAGACAGMGYCSFPCSPSRAEVQSAGEIAYSSRVEAWPSALSQDALGNPKVTLRAMLDAL